MKVSKVDQTPNSQNENSANNETNAPQQNATSAPARAENAPGYASVNLPPKKSHKKLIIGLSLGIGGFFLALIILIVVVTLGRISLADYHKASEGAEAAYKSASKLSAVSPSTWNSLSDSALEDKVEEVEDILTTLKEDFNKLGEQKAIKNDEDFREEYAELQEKFKDYVEYYNTVLENTKLMKIAHKLSGADGFGTTYEKSMTVVKDAQKDLQGLDFKYEINQTYKKNLEKCFDRVIPAIENYANMYKSGKYDATIYNEFSSARRECNNADSKQRSDINAKRRDANEFMTDLYDFYIELYNGKNNYK